MTIIRGNQLTGNSFLFRLLLFLDARAHCTCIHVHVSETNNRGITHRGLPRRHHTNTVYPCRDQHHAHNLRIHYSNGGVFAHPHPTVSSTSHACRLAHSRPLRCRTNVRAPPRPSRCYTLNPLAPSRPPSCCLAHLAQPAVARACAPDPSSSCRHPSRRLPHGASPTPSPCCCASTCMHRDHRVCVHMRARSFPTLHACDVLPHPPSTIPAGMPVHRLPPNATTTTASQDLTPHPSSLHTRRQPRRFALVSPSRRRHPPRPSSTRDDDDDVRKR